MYRCPDSLPLYNVSKFLHVPLSNCGFRRKGKKEQACEYFQIGCIEIGRSYLVKNLINKFLCSFH